MLKNLYTNHHWMFMAAIVAMTVLAGIFLVMPGYFAMHDDLQVMRFYELERCFLDGQIPCRWVPDMGNGYGFPMYNFYSPLPYYFGMIFRWLGWSFMDVVKVTFLSGMLISGIGMYWLMVKITKSPWAGLLASGLYLWAPYRAVQILVRGALAESWAMAWFPVVLLAIWLWVRRERKFTPWLPLALAGLYLSHNILAMWFTPILLGFVLVSLWEQKKLSLGMVGNFLVHYVWGLALAAFFIIPALVEQSLVRNETLTQDYFDFRLHFATWRQLLLDRSWGTGASRPGPEDMMSFQIGWPHWWLAIGAMMAGGWWFWKKQLKAWMLWGYWGAVFVGSVWLMHSKSVLFWELFSFVAVTQFPWRLLAITNLAVAMLGGLAIVKMGNKKLKQWLVVGILVVAVGLNWQYFGHAGYDPSATDADKLTGEAWLNQRNGAIRDFLPNTVQTFDIPPSEGQVVVETEAEFEGTGNARNLMIRSDYFSVDVEAGGSEPAKVTVPIFYFPNWEVAVDGVQVPVSADNELGLISFDIKPGGKRIVTGWFRNTPVRLLGNTITVVAYALLVLYVLVGYMEQPVVKPKHGKNKK